MHAYACVYIYIHIYICMYVYIYIYPGKQTYDKPRCAYGRLSNNAQIYVYTKPPLSLSVLGNIVLVISHSLQDVLQAAHVCIQATKVHVMHSHVCVCVVIMTVCSFGLASSQQSGPSKATGSLNVLDWQHFKSL